MTDPTNVPPPPPPAPSTAAFASWGARVLAVIIDDLPIAVAYFIFALLFGQNTAGAGSFSTNLSGIPALLFFVITIGWFVYNWGVKQGGTGKTLGKGVMNIAVFKAGTTEALGFGLSIGRQFVHVLDAIPCYLGYLWPLWDSENRTFADMILNTRVYKA